MTSPLRRGRDCSATTARPELQVLWRRGSRTTTQHVTACRVIRTSSEHIEHWHQILNYRILLNNHDLPGGLERQIDAFNVTPVDVNFGRAENIFEEWKRQTCRQRKPSLAASSARPLNSTPEEP